jgi:putative oxidoreductase
MSAFMSRFQDETYALFRMVCGFLFLWHGMQKLFSFPQPMPVEAPAFVVWIAGPIELVGGAMVMAGIQTRYAAFLCSGLMAFAYWMAHGLKHPLPSVNGGELAALYCFAFLFISARGAGIWSADRGR